MWIIQKNAVSDEQQDSIQQITDQLQVRWNGVFNINKQIDGI